MKRAATACALASMLLGFAALFSVAAFPARAPAQEPTGAGTAQVRPSPAIPPNRSAGAPDAVSQATLAQFAWLAGRWEGVWGPRVAQQVWMPPQSGTMVGVFQLTDNDRTLVVELFTIVSTRNGIELRVRHFTPSLTTWPVEKSGPALLKLATIDSKSIQFDSEDNGQPKHWSMQRNGPDTYVQRFEVVPEKGQSRTEEIVYHRQAVAKSR
jgi:Domain of unknown function (DUF6265)